MPTPSRLSEHAFRRFANVIRQALDDWPSPVRLPGKPSGVMQPLRYALRAKLNYHYPFPGIDDARFAELAPKLKVYEHDGSAWLGPPVSKVPLMPLPDGSTQYQLVEPAMLETLCRLVGNNALRPVPFFVVAGVPPLAREALAGMFGVEFLPIENKDGYYQVI